MKRVIIMFIMLTLILLLFVSCANIDFNPEIKNVNNNENNNQIIADLQKEIADLKDQLNNSNSDTEGIPNPITNPPTQPPTEPPIPTPNSTNLLQENAPFYESGANRNDEGSVQTKKSVTMGGSVYRDALTYSHKYTSWGNTVFSLHNLNGRFKELSGYVGRVDGANMKDATVNFYGDGELIKAYNVDAKDLPIEISVLLEDVKQLRIEFVYRSGSEYALIGFLE